MSNKLGFWSVFSIVTGSQIGSGVFMLPGSLAPYGVWGLFGYLVAGGGALALCYVFASLCARLPYTGGPHVYVQHAFGKTAGFFSGWTYWLISWISTTAVVVTSIGCLSPFFVNYSPVFYLLLEIILLIIITLINLKGVHIAGSTEFFLTLLKFVLLIILPVVALFYFNKQNLVVNKTIELSQSNFNILSKVTFLTLWGFIGLESATTPADAVYNPSVTIPKAVILGTLSVALLYVLNFIGVMGAVPAQILIDSKAPYVDVAQYIFGGNWHFLIAVVISIVCIGTLNAWVLTSGQIALGLSQDGLMPKIFSKKNKYNAPVVALIISNIAIVPLLIFIASKSFAEQILIIIDLSITAFLFVYLICCLSFFKLLLKEKKHKISNYFICGVALMFCLWVIYATPGNILLLSCLFVVSGIPMYLCWYKKKH